MRTQDIIIADDAKVLERYGLLAPTPFGKRVMNKAAMFCHNVLSPMARVRFLASETRFSLETRYQEDTVEIPQTLESVETLEFMGYTPGTAHGVYRHWCLRETDNLLRWAQHDIARKANLWDAEADTEEWRECINYYGIREELAEGIMDPEFREMRLTMSASAWVMDTLALRYRSLQAIQAASKKRVRNLSRSENGILMTSKQVARRVIPSGACRRGSRPGFTPLWRAIDVQGFRDEKNQFTEVLKTNSVFPHQTEDPERVKLDTLSTNSDRDLAKLHAAYIKRRANLAQVAIVRMDVPDSFIQDLRSLNLVFGDLWKLVVWMPRSLWGSRYFYYREAKQLTIGPVYYNDGEPLSRMKSWHEITRGCVLRIFKSGAWSEPLQYEFRGQDTLRNLEAVAEIELQEPMSEDGEQD